MSNQLDERARKAAASLNGTVARADLLTESIPGSVARRAPFWSLAAGGVAAALALFTVSLFRGPEIVAPATAVPATTVITTAASVSETSIAPVTTAAPVTTNAPVPTSVPADTTPPPISITFPTQGHVAEDKTITFTGTTEPGAKVSAGIYQATVKADGNWSITLILDAGETVARFVASDAAGNKAEASVTVVYKEEVPVAAEFTAHATFGQCELDPPYDVYYGTTTPGSKVTVTSDFGSGSVKAGGDGHWELKVVFASAPPGKTFLVKVADAFGASRSFEFVSLVG